MARRPRIAVDTMGGDIGVAAVVAAIRPLTEAVEVLLVGEPSLLARHGVAASEFTIIPSSERIDPGDSLAILLRQKRATPLHVALGVLARGEADAVVSGGDTGALMALARQALRMVPGVARPAIVKCFQGMRGRFYLLDLGANIDSSADVLRQFARMGVVVAEVGGLTNPRVGLLNVGTEAAKGPKVLKDCAALLSADRELNYRGFVEASALFDCDFDVIVCDGFAGNIALKAIEGAAAMALHLLNQQLAALPEPDRRALEATGMITGLERLLDPEQYNGAVLVGLSGVVVKSHGGAGATGFRRAVEEALAAVEGDLPRRLASAFAA